jgi:hypothetical protein
MVALGYLFFGIVCLAYSFLPGAKDPVEADEADIVAGRWLLIGCYQFPRAGG